MSACCLWVTKNEEKKTLFVSVCHSQNSLIGHNTLPKGSDGKKIWIILVSEHKSRDTMRYLCGINDGNHIILCIFTHRTNKINPVQIDTKTERAQQANSIMI